VSAGADYALGELPAGLPDKRTVSPTRKRTEWIIEEATSVRCLEAKVYAIPTEEANELPPGNRGTRVSEYLLDTIKPSVIVAHGNDANAVLESDCRIGSPVATCDDKSTLAHLSILLS